MKICKKCIQPDTRPGIYFENGICGDCIWEEEKKKIDWKERTKELQGIAEWAKKNNDGNYDCVIGVSGGKDSVKQAIISRDELGLRCLLVNSEPEGLTQLGRDNIENLKNLGFDVVSMRPNPKIIKKLMKRDFYKYLNPVKITEYSLYSSTYIIADKFDIPLIIQGENHGLTLGTRLSGVDTDSNVLKVNKSNTLSENWKEYLEVKGVEKKDLFLFHYDKEKLEKKNIRAIWIQYFLEDWSFRGNAIFSQKYGLKWRPDDFDPESIGAYMPFEQLDTDLTQVNQLLKYIKLGYGRCMYHACYDLRENRITRNEAINLVMKYDGKCSEFYIKKFCEYIEISIDDFWKTCNKFRGSMWKKNLDGIWHNTCSDMLK